MTPPLAVIDGLRERGYVVGKDLIIDAPKGLLQARAAELARNKPDLIFVYVCDAAFHAAREATQTIPIVVGACNDDLVAAGIVKSLAHPGTNVTGLSKLTPELAAKRLELLKVVAPRVSRVAILWNPAYADFAADWRQLRGAAERLGVTLQSVEVTAADELETGFAQMVQKSAEAVITFSDVLTYNRTRQVAALAAMHRLPMMSPFREMAEAGGLIAYGPDIISLYRRAGWYIDRILKGARADDLPIEQPTKFDLIINMKTAKALGLTVPHSLLLRADQVIECALCWRAESTRN
jgi:putative ABC transport system substrate-binding protein